MKPKILVLAPYELKILTALTDANLLNLASFIIVGDKNRIIMLCLKHNINYNLFEIYNEIGDFNICLKAEKIISENNIKYIITNNISKEIVKFMIDNLDDKILSNIFITSLPFVNHLLFYCYSEFPNIDFDDCSIALYETYKLMNELKINKTNIAIIEKDRTNNKKMEVDLIKMYWKEKLQLNHNIYTGVSLSEIFDRRSSVNVYNNLINLILLLEGNEINSFLYALNTYNNIKATHISLTNKFKIIDSSSIINSDDILFSIFLINKLLNTKVKSQVLV